MRTEKKDESCPAFETASRGILKRPMLKFPYNFPLQCWSRPDDLCSSLLNCVGASCIRRVMTWEKSARAKRALVATEHISFCWGMMYLLPTPKKNKDNKGQRITIGSYKDELAKQ